MSEQKRVLGMRLADMGVDLENHPVLTMPKQMPDDFSYVGILYPEPPYVAAYQYRAHTNMLVKAYRKGMNLEVDLNVRLNDGDVCWIEIPLSISPDLLNKLYYPKYVPHEALIQKDKTREFLRREVSTISMLCRKNRDHWLKKGAAEDAIFHILKMAVFNKYQFLFERAIRLQNDINANLPIGALAEQLDALSDDFNTTIAHYGGIV